MFSINPNCEEIVFNKDFHFSLSHLDIHLVRTWMLGNILQGGKAVAVFNRHDPFTETRISFVYKPVEGVPEDELIAKGIFEIVIGERAVKLEVPFHVSGFIDSLGQAIASERYSFHPYSEFRQARQRNDVYFLALGHTFIAGHDIFCFGEPQGWNEIHLNGQTPEDTWVQRVDITIE